jgi:hypothetical protein
MSSRDFLIKISFAKWFELVLSLRYFFYASRKIIFLRNVPELEVAVILFLFSKFAYRAFISRMRNLCFLSERIFLHLSNRRWSAHAEAQRSMALFPARKCSEKRPRDASSINRPRYLFLFTLAADKLISRRSDLK